MLAIKDGCSLSLEGLHFVDGRSEDDGGAVRANGAGDIALKGVSFTGCEANHVRASNAPNTAPLLSRS